MQPTDTSLPENLSQVKFPPVRVNLLTRSHWQAQEQKISDAWVRYMDRIHREKFILAHDEDKQARISRRSYSSRYTSQGQKKRARDIKSRYKDIRARCNTLLGMTFDPKKISRSEAWRLVNEDFRSFMDRVNKLRKRRGWKKRLIYTHVLEIQDGTGYPHIHVAFPGLKSLLIKRTTLQEMWGRGSVSVDSFGGVGAVHYTLKYIFKSFNEPLMMAYMFNYRLRQYSFSRDFLSTNSSEEGYSGWRFVKKSDSGSGDLVDIIREFSSKGYYIQNPELMPISCSSWALS